MSIKISDASFQERTENSLTDQTMRQAIRDAQTRLQRNYQVAKDTLGDWEAWREKGKEIREHTLNHLDVYLEQLSDRVIERGGNVFFAKTKDEANEYIQRVVKEKKAKKIVKSKSMVTEEIGLNEALTDIGCEVVETDLGEYILQVDNQDPPSHIVAPALHKNKVGIRDVFKEKLGYEHSENPEELTLFARKKLREKFLQAEVGITGCNFAVSETGSFTLVTNEGNGRMVTTLPDTLITVMGMERIVPTLEDLDVVVSLLTRASVGQKLTSYITTFTGPKYSDEADGPEDFHLVIVDNGRSNILGTKFQSILHCIRCAACINICPIYRHIGGHAYGSIYPGPVGAILSPLLGDYEHYKELPYASSLCGACTNVCPVKIPLHELLIEHRREMVEERRLTSKGETMLMESFGQIATSPYKYKTATKLASYGAKMFSRNGMIQKGPGPLKEWTKNRYMEAPKTERFRDWVKKREKKDES